MPALAEPTEPPRIQMWTDHQFLDWLEPGLHADLIDGEKFMHSPVNLNHARLVNSVHYLLRRWLENSEGGGEIFQEVVAVRLSQRNVFLPDLSWFSPEQLPRFAATHAPFAPAWLCEVLSPRTADRDLGPKFAAYEEHGVQEYWVLDPSPAHRHQFFFREDDYLVAHEPTDGWITSRVIPGFRARPEWLDPDNLPLPTDCLTEIQNLSC